MTISIISRRETKTVINYQLCYDNRTKRNGSGYAFDCHNDGTLMDRSRAAHARFAEGEQLDNPEDWDGPHIRSYQTRWVEPAVGRCVCGHSVVLADPLDNECDECHRWYNMVGQEVVSPESQLGRELRADDDRYADDDY